MPGDAGADLAALRSQLEQNDKTMHELLGMVREHIWKSEEDRRRIRIHLEEDRKRVFDLMKRTEKMLAYEPVHLDDPRWQESPGLVVMSGDERRATYQVVTERAWSDRSKMAWEKRWVQITGAVVILCTVLSPLIALGDALGWFHHTT